MTMAPGHIFGFIIFNSKHVDAIILSGPLSKHSVSLLSLIYKTLISYFLIFLSDRSALNVNTLLSEPLPPIL
jgi:hypothetical protein